MNGESAIYAVYFFMMVVGFILFGIFAFRSIFKFLDWRDENPSPFWDSNAFWGFTSLALAAAASIILAIAGIGYITDLYPSEIAFELSIYPGFVLALAAVGVSTLSTILKWIDHRK